MSLKKSLIVFFGMLTAVLPVAAQMGMGMGGRVPALSGIWHPVVGSGASYDVTKSDGTKMPYEILIVGKEDVDGKPAYWMEMSMVDGRTSSPVYVKSLMSVNENRVVSSRMIMQMPGQDPMEIDSAMAAQSRRMQEPSPSDINDKAEVVGTESITVPAGTFNCQHYRMKDGSGDAWVSDKVAPWGLVKGMGKGETIVLTKAITDAKDHITGTPRKFDPAEMMRNRQRGQ
jgi:hypothetical protein